MESSKPLPLKAHLFVCTNERSKDDPRGCCLARGSEQVLKAFKSEIARAGLAVQVRAQRAGCLDQCEYGPTVVVYPEGVWYGNVSEADVPEIVRSHLLEGKPCKRLMIPDK